MEKIGYEVEGTVVETLKEVASMLGVSKVTTKDLEDGKYADSVSVVDLEEEARKADENWENEARRNKPKHEKHPMESDIDPSVDFTTLTGDEPEISKEEVLESFPKFDNLEELKEIIRELDTHTLEYLAKGLELNWTPTYHVNIHRMRIAMSMHKHFFPELFEPKESKKKAKYSDMSTKELMKLLEDNKLEFKASGNEAIDRMKAIMLLKSEGHVGA